MTSHSSYNAKPAIARALCVLRNEKGMTRAEVAKSIGTTESSIIRYENGQRTPDVNTMYALADAYKVTPGDFFPSKEIINNAVQYTKENHGNSDQKKD